MGTAMDGCNSARSAGLLGRPFAVTHVYDLSFAWTRGTHFDEMKHFGLYDYSVHWVDIGVRWLRPARPLHVTARDYRLQCQPNDSHTPWGLDISVVMSDASTIVIRGIGGSSIRRRRHPFMVHGTAGIARGSVLDGDELELETEGVRTSFPLEGDWFPDGFAGSMGELLRAIVEGGEPDNGAHDGLSTLAVVLGAVESSENEGVPVDLGQTRGSTLVAGRRNVNIWADGRPVRRPRQKKGAHRYESQHILQRLWSCRRRKRPTSLYRMA